MNSQTSKPAHRDHLPYWLEDEPVQNFGDYLTAYFEAKLFIRTPRRPGETRIVGSCIDDGFVRLELLDTDGRQSPQKSVLTVWACGVRRHGGISRERAQAVKVLSVRGPLSISELGLGASTPIGDPGLLLPSLYKPLTVPQFANKLVCVPHFNDTRSDAEIVRITGADLVLRPGIRKTLKAIEEFVDALTSARFVLCGSLHAAIVAAAYGRAFAFWDSGDIDIPFKWHDFAESVGIPTEFQPEIVAGQRHYESAIRESIQLPELWRTLAVAPYFLRPAALLRLLRHEQARLDPRENPIAPALLDQLISLFDEATPQLEDIAAQATDLLDRMADQVAALQEDLGTSRQQLDEAQATVTNLTNDVQARVANLTQALQASEETLRRLRRSSSWRITAPYRALRSLMRPPIRALERSDLLYRAVTAPLLLPAYVAYKGDLHGFYKSWRRNSGFVPSMIAVQEVIRDRLLQRSNSYRRLASIGFSVAFRVHDSGGVFRTLRQCLRILRREGLGAARDWLFESVPGRARSTSPDGHRGGTPASLDPDVQRRILVADRRVPNANVSTGERATLGILKDLRALGCDVTFLSTDMVPSPAAEDQLRAIGVEAITVGSGFKGPTDYLAERGYKFGAFYLMGLDVAEQLLSSARKEAPQARIIFHATDLCLDRELREAVEARNALGVQRETTTAWGRLISIAGQSDHVVVGSEADRALMQSDLPGSTVSVSPASYAPIATALADFAARRNILFLGALGHSHNVDAVQWFAKNVWPIVRSSLPDTEFLIVGADAPDAILALGNVPGIRLVGFVQDLGPILEATRIGVAPPLHSAGTDGELPLLLGAGVPCVCTTIAAQDLSIENGVHAIVANDPASFADAVISIYRDATLWHRLSLNGQSLAQNMFGDDACRTALLEALNAAGALPLGLYCDYSKRVATAGMPASPEGGPLDVSIIVPVGNEWHLARACVASVIETSRGSGVTFEIILVHDESSDETARASEVFPGLCVAKRQSEMGLLHDCNSVARTARGRYVLLLDHRAIVLPGWLKALYRTIDPDPTIAIVGSKMLSVDGHILEAGGGLMSDGSCVDIVVRPMPTSRRGTAVDRYSPIFNVERETDFVSAASMLVRKSFWDSVGGFDERYPSTSGADADLGMAARASGMRVVYQTAAELVQCKLQSAIEPAEADQVKAMAHRSMELLFEKWRETLERDHLPPGSSALGVAAHGDRTASLAARERRRNGRLNVLYFSPFPSHPSNHGNQATIQQFARRFQSMGHKVHFALLQSGNYTPTDLEAMRNAWDTLDVLPNTHGLGANGEDIPFDGWYQEGLGENIRVLCARHDIDIVFCSYVFQSKLLEFVPAHILKVIDTHDKMGDRYKMLRANGQPLEFFSCTPEEEGAYLRRADIVVARREEEARYFDSVTGLASAIVIPHVEEPHFVDKKFDALHNVGIVASANRINLAIVRECLESINRALRGKDCPFTVHIAGQVKDMVPSLPASEAAVFDQPWVRMHGFVPDIASFYAGMDIVVSPVTMGTGINVKTVQAMAHGMPLISTEWGTKGIETDEPMHHHKNLDELSAGLLDMSERTEKLNQLAEVSRQRYAKFLEMSSLGFKELFRHPKIVGSKPD